MRIRLLYFAQAARLCERAEETFELAEPATLSSLEAQVLERHPGLRGIAANLQWAIDEEIAEASAPLRDGLTVAVLPPFSGG